MTDTDAIMITQAVDEEDPVLGFTPGWINALAKNLRRLSVYCLRAGKHSLRDNVSLHVLGEGKAVRLQRLRTGLRADVESMKARAIFAHMCPRYAVAASSIVRQAVPIFLWYAHSAKSLWLSLAHKVSRFVLTPTVESCPMRSPKVLVVGHGIDAQKFSPRPAKRRDGVVLLSAGRIAPLKRYDFLIEAVAQAAKSLPPGELRLRILGSPCVPQDEMCLSALTQLVRKTSLEHLVEFRPAVPYTQIEHEYADCDVFVSTAIRHSIDKAPLEAMASGKLVVTSNRNFRSVLGEHADLLVADDEKPGDLAGKIVAVARMEQSERERLGLVLRDIVIRDHDLGRLMEKIAHLISAATEG